MNISNRVATKIGAILQSQNATEEVVERAYSNIYARNIVYTNKPLDMREPIVPNKYNLTREDCDHLIVKDMDAIHRLFKWNGAVGAWIKVRDTAMNHDDYKFGTYNSYFINVFEDGKVKVSFAAYGDMCTYNFNNFYDYSEIENECDDLKIQEMFLEKINYLIDNNILGIDNTTK